MYEKLELLWSEMVKNLEQKNDKDNIIKKNKYNIFLNFFTNEYDKILRNNMQSSVEHLDRHKVAAIIINSIIKADVLDTRSTNQNSDQLYEIAISTGLSYMQYELNHTLLCEHKKTIDKYSFPQVMFGKSSYLDNLVKLLRFSDLEDNYNTLSMANTLFLLEKTNLMLQ